MFWVDINVSYNQLFLLEALNFRSNKNILTLGMKCILKKDLYILACKNNVNCSAILITFLFSIY